MDGDRKIFKRLNLHGELDDGYVQNDMSKLISVVWEITYYTWSFVRRKDAEQRLQIDFTAFIGRSNWITIKYTCLLYHSANYESDCHTLKIG